VGRELEPKLCQDTAAMISVAIIAQESPRIGRHAWFIESVSFNKHKSESH